jgi:hypothetical protein
VNEVPKEIRERFPDAAARDAAPIVAPREGCMGLCRNGEIVGPFERLDPPTLPYMVAGEYLWNLNGGWAGTRYSKSRGDIIAVWPPSEPQPHADPLDAVKAAIRGLSDDDLARMVFETFGALSYSPGICDQLRNWAKGDGK